MKSHTYKFTHKSDAINDIEKFTEMKCDSAIIGGHTFSLADFGFIDKENMSYSASLMMEGKKIADVYNSGAGDDASLTPTISEEEFERVKGLCNGIKWTAFIGPNVISNEVALELDLLCDLFAYVKLYY